MLELYENRYNMIIFNSNYAGLPLKQSETEKLLFCYLLFDSASCTSNITITTFFAVET